MNRGSAAEAIIASRDSCSLRCFNEAPIHESGKCKLAGDVPNPRLALRTLQ